MAHLGADTLRFDKDTVKHNEGRPTMREGEEQNINEETKELFRRLGLDSPEVRRSFQRLAACFGQNEPGTATFIEAGIKTTESEGAPDAGLERHP